MATSKLPALARPVYQPPDHPCVVCSAPFAERGYGERYYCTPCVPPAMRFPWEAGYVAVDQAAPAAPIAAPAAQAAFDLLPGFEPA